MAEVVANGFPEASRSWVDRLLDARIRVPDKLARLLRRNPAWCSGEALYALGGRTLLNPLAADDMMSVLRGLGTVSIQRRPTDRGTELVIAQRSN